MQGHHAEEKTCSSFLGAKRCPASARPGYCSARSSWRRDAQCSLPNQDPAWVPPTAPGQAMKRAETKTYTTLGSASRIPCRQLTVPLGTLLADATETVGTSRQHLV